jgi:hypothetical protein
MKKLLLKLRKVGFLLFWLINLLIITSNPGAPGSILRIPSIILVLVVIIYLIYRRKNRSKFKITTGYGKFGMVKTNPIPLKHVLALTDYLPQLRYPYISKTGFMMYFPVQFKRTMDSDDTPIGSSISNFSGIAAATSSSNIGHNIDVYNLYDQSGSKLAKIYLHGYQSYTSSKAPQGFVLASDIPDEQDSVKVMEKFENLSEDEKQKLGQDVIDKMNK